MSGHCDFCGIWHSGPCCHPCKMKIDRLQARVAELETGLITFAERYERAECAIAELTRERDEWLDRCTDAQASADIARKERDAVVRIAQYDSDEDEKLKSYLAAARALLPGVYYMDPPDGGDVDLIEQLRRMANDATRYRWLRSIDSYKEWNHCGRYAAGALDAAIDAELAGGGKPNDNRPCTCHPEDDPPVPCQHKYALDECIRSERDIAIAAQEKAESDLAAARALLMEAQEVIYDGRPNARGDIELLRRIDAALEKEST